MVQSNPKSVERSPMNDYQTLRFQDPPMNKRPDFFEKFKGAILLYQSSLEHKVVLKLKKTQLFYLVIKLMKPFATLREVSVSHFSC